MDLGTRDGLRSCELRLPRCEVRPCAAAASTHAAAASGTCPQVTKISYSVLRPRSIETVVQNAVKMAKKLVSHPYLLLFSFFSKYQGKDGSSRYV